MSLLSKVIKGHEYNEVIGIPDVIIGNDAHSQSQLILNKAFEKAKQIVSDAQQYSANHIKETRERMNADYEKMRKQGQEEGIARGIAEGKKKGMDLGYKAGYEDGLKNADEENRLVLNELQFMMEKVEKEKSKILQTHEDDIKTLALNIAKKIIKKEISLDDTTMLGIIKNATDSYRNQAWVRIYVSEERVATLLQVDNNLIQVLSDVSDNVKVIANPSMSEFDCVIEMPDQIIDAGVEIQVKNIEAALSIVQSQSANC